MVKRGTLRHGNVKNLLATQRKKGAPGLAGAGRPKKSDEVRRFEEFCRKLLSDPAVRRAYYNRARNGKLQPAELSTFAAHGYGKPKETIENLNGGPQPVTIVHHFADDKPKPKPKDAK